MATGSTLLYLLNTVTKAMSVVNNNSLSEKTARNNLTVF